MALSIEVTFIIVVLLPEGFDVPDGGVVGGVLPIEGGSSRNCRITIVFSSNLINTARRIDLSRAQSEGQPGASIDLDLARRSLAVSWVIC